MAQFWVGSTDVHFMLTQIGGWHVGCQNEVEASTAVQYARDRRYVTERTHYAEAFPEGSQAYELTDLGLDYVRKFSGEKAFEEAFKMRKWYRDRAHLRFPANRSIETVS